MYFIYFFQFLANNNDKFAFDPAQNYVSLKETPSKQTPLKQDNNHMVDSHIGDRMFAYPEDFGTDVDDPAENFSTGSHVKSPGKNSGDHRKDNKSK